MIFESGEYFLIVDIVFGIYLIIRAVMTLTTGKLPPREENGLRDYSEKGIRRYKLLSVVIYFITGLLLIGITVIKLLHLIDRNVLRIGTVAIFAVMLVVYFLVRNSCKNLK